MAAVRRSGSKRIGWIVLAIVLGGCGAAFADEGMPPPAAPPEAGLPKYQDESRFLVEAPGSSSSLGAGMFNPAVWGIRPEGGLFFAWEDSAGTEKGPIWGRPDWLGVLGVGGLTWAMRGFSNEGPRGCLDRWYEQTIGLSGGDKAHAFGLSYTWNHGEDGPALRHRRLAIGSIQRTRYASIGVSSLWDVEKNDHQIQADLGVRPIGPRATLFTEAIYRKGQEFDEIDYGYGLEVQPYRGLALGVRAFNTGEFGLRLRVGIGGEAFPEARVHLDNDGEHVGTTYVFETELPAPDLGLARKGKSYPEIDLKGPIAYQRYRFFDDRRTLLGLLRQLERQAADPRVGGVVLNLSGLVATPEVLWEVREQLAGFRAQGKKVIVYFDRAGIGAYALASVADQIWMDPLGDLEIPGLVFSRTYMRGMLDKMGLGFDEWRFFTYKSALESFSRTSMSDADREQLDAMVGDFYETMAGLVISSRGITREAWDHAVNEKGMLLPREALEAGLVDSVGTFEQAKKAAKKAERRATADPTSADLAALRGDPVWEKAEWGLADRIALLYAIGPCDMDTGIRGRLLGKKMKEAADNKRIKAIVLRADSPGGDALASDLVSREMKEAAKKKPVIVSQGQVAGSGGYWISMHADSILAAPVTITGSIGVIGGWIWDNGLGDKLGITYDKVQRGDHADLGRGMVLPLVNAVVPERPMTEMEKARVEETIREMYAGFVKQVAEGRGMTEEQIDKIGQGRVWSGVHGAQIGLVDELGGMWRSLEMAKDAAGIPRNRAIRIEEGPGLGAFHFPFPEFKLFGMRTGARDESSVSVDALAGEFPAVSALEARIGGALGITMYERAYLERILRAQGRPLLMMEPIQGTDGVMR